MARVVLLGPIQAYADDVTPVGVGGPRLRMLLARLALAAGDDLLTAAAEDRCDAELRLGRHAEVPADLEAAGAERPLSARVAGLRMRALSTHGGQCEGRTTSLPRVRVDLRVRPASGLPG
ncbi:BTAD domain-containing putative transcriptional regulator [Streptomyces zaehneri]|uniref:BTAD domain-containing putative transcriptional regulator n=1 Tax=Streptomyces zaehneri TaxID=3051180 RepID=UPI0028D4DF35|nr:BTAD domain-containing putative transcriptional regulator [Streptomyces sp. DSM 40713]